MLAMMSSSSKEKSLGPVSTKEKFLYWLRNFCDFSRGGICAALLAN
jgi:hypothetical protein